MTTFGESPLTSQAWKSTPLVPYQFSLQILYLICCHVIRVYILRPVALVNAEKYSNLSSLYRPPLRSVRTLELRSEYFSELTAQSVNKCLLVHSGNMAVMALLSLLHLSQSANEAERIIYISKLFHETSCSTKKPCSHDAISCTQRLSDSMIR